MFQSPVGKSEGLLVLGMVSDKAEGHSNRELGTVQTLTCTWPRVCGLENRQPSGRQRGQVSEVCPMNQTLESEVKMMKLVT